MSVTDYVIDVLLITYYANHSGAGTVVRFSVRHDISGPRIWTAALVLMASGQVLSKRRFGRPRPPTSSDGPNRVPPPSLHRRGCR